MVILVLKILSLMRCPKGFPAVSGKYAGGAENQDKASLSHLISACVFFFFSHAHHTSLRHFCFGLTDTLPLSEFFLMYDFKISFPQYIQEI